MPSTTNYNFGDVVLVGFPFTNLKTSKKRPAVIISNTDYQQNRPDVILLVITSQIRHPLQLGEALVRDWQTAGLAKPSVFKPLIATIERDRIVKTMGKLTADDQANLRETLKNILGI